MHNNIWYLLLIFNKYGIAFSGKFLSPYNISYKKNTGFPEVIKYLSYITMQAVMVPSENSYYIKTMLGTNFFVYPLHPYSVGYTIHC